LSFCSRVERRDDVVVRLVVLVVLVPITPPVMVPAMALDRFKALSFTLAARRSCLHVNNNERSSSTNSSSSSPRTRCCDF